MIRINISIEKNKDGFLASATDVKGTHCQGKTKNEAIELVKKEVERKIAGMSDEEIYWLKTRDIFTRPIEIDLD